MPDEENSQGSSPATSYGPRLGMPVVWHGPEGDLAATIARVNDDGTFHLVVFAPNAVSRDAEGVKPDELSPI